MSEEAEIQQERITQTEVFRQIIDEMILNMA